MNIEDVEKAGNDFCNEYRNGWSAKLLENVWEKNGHSRVYFELREYRNGSHRSTRKCGYWDNNAEQYVVTAYGAKAFDLITREYR